MLGNFPWKMKKSKEADMKQESKVKSKFTKSTWEIWYANTQV